MAGGTTPIYDISGEQPVLGDMPHEQIQDAVASGKFSFPKGQDVSVVSPDGTFGTVPADRAPDALRSGYKYATPDMLGAQARTEKYSTPGQQLGTLAEGVAQGALGPIATAAEEGLSKLGVPGMTAEDRSARAETNPVEHGVAEVGGFAAPAIASLGGSALLRAGLEVPAALSIASKFGQAPLIAKAGEAVASGLGLGGEGASVASRLAAGATKMATELGAFQAGDEATKAINQDPNASVGSAASHILLSGLLGGVAGIPLTGLGIASKAAINSQFLKDFTDRLSFRGSNVDVNAKLIDEFSKAQELYHEMGSEVGGVTGIRAQAMGNLIPEVNEHIVGQAQNIANKIDAMATKLAQSGDKSGMVDQLRRQAARINESLNPNMDTLTMQPQSAVTSSNIYDTLNSVKRQLGEWGKFEKGVVPLNEVAFRNASKTLGFDLKTALEDQGIWGKAGSLQKELNGAWHEAIPAMKDAESKFMTKIGGEPTVDPTKFNTYINQNGKATSQTIRQQMMGKFVDAVDRFHSATSKAYEAAGVENPFQSASMNTIKDSLSKPSIGSKLADLWYTRLGPTGLGEALGGATGFGLGHMTGFPEAGFGGAYLGKWVLGPAFTSIIKPIMEKAASMPAFNQSLAYAKAVMEGNAHLTNAAVGVFGSAAKTLPSHLWPQHSALEKLDQKLKDTASNESGMLNVAGNLDHYSAPHAQAVSQTAMTAVKYLNSLRPSNPKMSPLDSEIPVSKAQQAPFYRSLAVAQQPLVAMDHIKHGTLLPQDVATIKAIYPGYYNKMSQELTSAMTDHLSTGKSVPYKTRQAMSLFLGQAMDSTMSPASIQSAQAIYANNGPTSQKQAPATTKKGTSKLGKLSENMMTNEQARSSRAMQG